VEQTPKTQQNDYAPATGPASIPGDQTPAAPTIDAQPTMSPVEAAPDNLLTTAPLPTPAA
jgi:hypothetical protein